MISPFRFMGRRVSGKVRNISALLSRHSDVLAALRAMVDQTIMPTRDHLDLCADFLLNASRHSTDGGYSAFYSLIHGWQKGYIETTGYMIPTGLQLATILDRPEVRQDALANGDWLLSHQNPDGSFPGINRSEPKVFDTGQVLIGLQRLFVETGDQKFEAAGRRTCDWLCCVQDDDGSWTCEEGRSPTYLTRTAAALMDFGKLVNEPRYLDGGKKFLHWAEPKQLPSGLFRNSELKVGNSFLLHTVMYVLEGFLHAWTISQDERWLDAALRGAEPIRDLCLKRAIVPYSYYDADLQPVTAEKCITGLSQWAGLCLNLYRVSGNSDYIECASNALFYIKSKQLRTPSHLRGALPGSVPVWGRYLKWAFPNWNVKFFADALIDFETTHLSVREQQEIWVRRAHVIYGDKVGWTAVSSRLEGFDHFTLSKIENIIRRHAETPHRSIVVVDLGCGEGRCLKWLESRNPGWTLIGIDPIDSKLPTGGVLVGSANRIPLEDGAVDCVFALIALQHVADIEGALAEVRRVLRNGGIFIVFDRNPASIRGFLKRWHELNGRWLYIWDSPFRERWYSFRRWRSLFRGAGYRIIASKSFTDLSGRGWKGRLPVNRFIMLAAQKKQSSSRNDLTSIANSCS